MTTSTTPLADRIRAAAIARAERRTDAARAIACNWCGRPNDWQRPTLCRGICAACERLAPTVFARPTVPPSSWVARALASTLPPREYGR